MSQHASTRRTRLQLEHLGDRLAPSALLGDPPAHAPAPPGGPHAAAVARAPGGHAAPFTLAFQCSGDVNSLTTTATGFATGLGHWTGQGHVDPTRTHIDPDADRAEINGTFTVVAANGDTLFVSFTSSWQPSTGVGTESIAFTGGTGRFAGASGSATLDCTITADPESPTTFTCNCEGSGTLVLDHSR
jgi:hypothetical protein